METAILNLNLVTRLENCTTLAADIGNLAMAGLGCQYLIDRVALGISHLDYLSSLFQQ